jgi:hypothetical protein
MSVLVGAIGFACLFALADLPVQAASKNGYNPLSHCLCHVGHCMNNTTTNNAAKKGMHTSWW